MYPKGSHRKPMLLSWFLVASFFLSSLACASSEFHFVEPPSMRHVAADATDHEPCADDRTEAKFCTFLRQQLTSLQNEQQVVSLLQASMLPISTEPAVSSAVLIGSAAAAAALCSPPQLSPQLSSVILRI
jgi:hypothetical protein